MNRANRQIGTGDGAPSLRAAIEAHEGRLSRSDQTLVQHVLQDPRGCAFLSAAELAARIGVHSSTVVRLAHKLGFGGYPELRAALQRDVLHGSDPDRRIARQLSSQSEGTILENLVARDHDYLARLVEHVRQEDIDGVADALLAARQVVLFGIGTSVSLVTLLERRLRRYGLVVVRAGRAAREAAEAAGTLDERDALLALAFHSVPHGLSPLLAHAGKVGAVRVLISDTLGPLIRPVPEHLLAAPRGVPDEYQTATVPMAICNALILTMSARAPERTVDGLRRYADLRRTFHRDPGPEDGGR